MRVPCDGLDAHSARACVSLPGQRRATCSSLRARCAERLGDGRDVPVATAALWRFRQSSSVPGGTVNRVYVDEGSNASDMTAQLPAPHPEVCR